MTTAEALGAVTNALRVSERSALDLIVAIKAAAAEGHSLRAIADAAGVSHEKVRQILRG